MAPRPRLVLSEEKIRERSGLGPHRDLAELRSLSIPGTYQEKITHLGSSLMRLTVLKSLDLSRNSLVSLEGIQHLVSLESLNLYYNCISSLAEVFRLHSLAELQDLDLRLNPVVKSESDYRLFVVHMLPKLRQLDDRPVRESERKASQLHFASEDSLDSKECCPAALKVESCPLRLWLAAARTSALGSQDPHPRQVRPDCDLRRWDRAHHSWARCADPSARKFLVMDADDEAVLNLIAECEWDLSNPPGSLSSSQKEREADLHHTQALLRCTHQKLGPLLALVSVDHQCGDSARRGHEKKKGNSRDCCPEQPPQDQHCGELPPQHGDPEACCTHGLHAHFTPHPDSTDIGDSVSSSQRSSLSSQKALSSLPVPDKYRKRRMPGGRFQAPSDWECLSCLEMASGPCSLEEGPSGQDSSEGRNQRAFPHSEASEAEEQILHSTGDARVPSPRPHSVASPGKRAVLEWALLEALLDLVDRHWSGCKSLHGNQAFLAQAKHILSSVQEFAAAQDGSELGNEEISHLALENKSLQNRLAEHQQQYTTTLNEVTSELSSTRREMDALRQHLDKSLEENSSLKSLLSSMKKEVKSADASAALNLQISGLQASVKRLSGEVVELKQHLEHYDRVQGLTQMLQESHSSLVSTNEHLLQELGRVRAQHRAEVEQMHWSFQELKKTAALFPPRSTSLGGRQSC